MDHHQPNMSPTLSSNYTAPTTTLTTIATILPLFPSPGTIISSTATLTHLATNLLPHKTLLALLYFTFGFVTTQIVFSDLAVFDGLDVEPHGGLVPEIGLIILAWPVALSTWIVRLYRWDSAGVAWRRLIVVDLARGLYPVCKDRGLGLKDEKKKSEDDQEEDERESEGVGMGKVQYWAGCAIRTRNSCRLQEASREQKGVEEELERRPPSERRAAAKDGAGDERLDNVEHRGMEGARIPRFWAHHLPTLYQAQQGRRGGFKKLRKEISEGPAEETTDQIPVASCSRRASLGTLEGINTVI